jgi:putative membrane protein
MMHWGNWGGYGWGMGFGWIIMILFWALVILGIVYFLQLAVKSKKGSCHCEDPMDILKTRYARGEITREQFDDMQQDLKKA